MLPPPLLQALSAGRGSMPSGRLWTDSLLMSSFSSLPARTYILTLFLSHLLPHSFYSLFFDQHTHYLSSFDKILYGAPKIIMVPVHEEKHFTIGLFLFPPKGIESPLTHSSLLLHFLSYAPFPLSRSNKTMQQGCHCMTTRT